MPAIRMQSVVICALSLSLFGCGDTIVYETADQQDAASGNGVFADPASIEAMQLADREDPDTLQTPGGLLIRNETGNSLSFPGDASSNATDIAASGSIESDSYDNAAASLINLLDDADGTVVGAPGLTVDCASRLPCRWISADQSVAVTATSADNIAERSRLSVQFRIDTTHDTNLVLGTSSPARDVAGLAYKVTQQTLGGGNGIAPQAVRAGEPALGHLDYDQSAAGSLGTWSILVQDNGLPRDASFLNVPVGSAGTPAIDCAYRLPCVWTTTDGMVTITLLSAGGFASTGRLGIGFSIETLDDRIVAVDSGTIAAGDDGLTFESRTHMLAQQSGYERLAQPAAAGTTIPGSFSFHRSDARSETLQSLTLSVFDDAPIPRWNPEFSRVPLQ